MIGWLRTRRIWTLRETSLACVLAVVYIVFSFLSHPFSDPVTLLDQSRYWIEIGIMAPAMMLLVMVRGIDLSVASTLALCGVVTVRLTAETGLPWPAAAVAGLFLGLLAGMVNGLLGAFARIPDLIVTLATMVIFRGFAQLASQNRVYSNLPEGYRFLGEGTILGGLPVQWAVMLGIWAMLLLFLHFSRFGRYCFAIGSNPVAAVYAALPVKKMRIALYMLSGFLAASAALIYTARNNTAKSDDAGGFELDVITCVVLGGASIRGGRGSAAGLMLAVLILGLSRTGFMLTGVPALYQRIATGAVLVITASLNEWIFMRRAAALQKSI